jgi:outer membrane lipoprotein SlyB
MNTLKHAVVAPVRAHPRTPSRKAWAAGLVLGLSTALSAIPAIAATSGGSAAPSAKPRPVAACPHCGTVESVQAVRQKGQGTGVGAVAGAVLGGVVGHQFGSGSGRTAMTALGAVGGGVAGNEVERRSRSVTRFKVQVRMDDGSHRTFWRSDSVAVGSRVVADGKSLRVAGR